MPYLWKPHDGGEKPKRCLKCRKADFSKRQKEAPKNVEKRCVQCGSYFLVDRWKASLKKYCSKRCLYQYHSKKGGTVEVPCDICGKVVKRNPSNVQKNNYCGYECMGRGKILDAPRTNNWANVRAWFSRFNRMSKCETCGYSEVPEILVVHHKDRDRENNHLSNLAVLCPNCHAIEHLAENKRGWKGHRSSNPVKVKARLATKEKTNV
jgi:hypothetical protein